MRLTWRAGLALALLLMIQARTGSGAPQPGSGLSLIYQLDLISEGKRSEETLRVHVGDPDSAGLLPIELSLEGSGERFRALYARDGEGPRFGAGRFQRVQAWDGAWRDMGSGEVEILAALEEVEALASHSPAGPDSVITVGGTPLTCHSASFGDSTTSVQNGETVTMRIVTERWGRLWTSDSIPFGGWLRYEEHRASRKQTEFSGHSFVGDVEHSQETWQLVALSRD